MIKNKSKSRNDLILVLSFIVIAIVSWLILNFTKKPGDFAVVIQNGVEIARYPLSVDTEVRLENPMNKGYNILIIKDGKADVIEASCPDKICVNQRPISRTGETITCLPNKTVIKVQSADPDNQNEIDFMS